MHIGACLSSQTARDTGFLPFGAGQDTPPTGKWEQTKNGRFQFGEILGAKPEPGKSPDTVSFTALKVNSPAIRRVRFFWRQDWYGAIFLNGEKAGEDVDGVDPAWTERTIELQAGENEILFRSRPGVGGYWFAGFAIDDPKGELAL